MFTYHGITIQPNEVIKYARKSRTDDPLLSVTEVLEKHEKILAEWCMRNFGELVPESNSYQEIGSGETIAARPIFQEILRLIELPKYKAILAVDIQRLSRGDLEDAGRLIKLLRYTNTFVITTDTIFDLADEYDRERFKRELERGNDYLEYYKKINLRGRMESVRAGFYIGSVPPYGYDRVFIPVGRKKRPTLAINEHEAEVVRLIFDLYVNQDMGMVNIAHRLTALGYQTQKGALWTNDRVKDVLENVHYIGKVKWNHRKTVTVVEDGEISKTRPTNKDYYIFDGQHPAIIDEDLFERAQKKLGRNHRAKKGTQLRNPLAGIVYCQCGKAMTYRTYKNPDGTERSAPRLLCVNQMYCHTQSVTYSEILDKVVDVLKNCIADFEIKIQNDKKGTKQNRDNQIARLEARLEELTKKELSQWEKYSEEGMPKDVFTKLNAKVLKEKETVLAAIETAKLIEPTVEIYQEHLMRFKDALEALESPKATAQQKNRLLRDCIKRIDYSRAKGNRWHTTEYELDITLTGLFLE